MNVLTRLTPALLLPIALAVCPGASGQSAELKSPSPGPGVGAVGSTTGAAGSGGVAGESSAAHASAFAVLGTTPGGRALFVALPAARTVEAAILSTADELARVLDAKPTVSGAFADSRSKRRGGAQLTGKLAGHDVRGWIFCGVENTTAGATATVIVTAADATPADLGTLFAFLPGKVAMQTHAYPDGSGSIDLPEGWTTPQQSATHGVYATGPGGQYVGIMNSILVNTPDCQMVQIRQKTYEMALGTYKVMLRNYQNSVAQHERNPNAMVLQEPKAPVAPDPEREWPQLIFCRYCSGAQEVLDNLYPVAERRAKKAGGRYGSLERIIEVVPADANPYIANAKAGVAYLAVADHDGDKVTHMRVINRIETYPVLDGKNKWVATYNNVRAPDETFDRDLPMLNDIMASFKLNMDVVGKQMQQEGEALRQAADANQRLLLQRGRDFNAQQAEHFNRFQAQMAAQSKARHDSNSDFIEYISGVRHVYDSQTGLTHGVDLFNSHAIVEGMNTAGNDPNRFVEIPLRNER